MNDLIPIDSKADITPDRLQVQSRSLRYTGRPHDADVMLWCAERITELNALLDEIAEWVAAHGAGEFEYTRTKYMADQLQAILDKREKNDG